MTDRIAEAIEQHGAQRTVEVPREDGSGSVERRLPDIEVRIGAILARERIAQDWARLDHGRDPVRVIEILCADIRENAPASGARGMPPCAPANPKVAIAAPAERAVASEKPGLLGPSTVWLRRSPCSGEDRVRRRRSGRR